MFLLESESHAIGNDELLLFSKERRDLDRMMVKTSHKFKMQPEVTHGIDSQGKTMETKGKKFYHTYTTDTEDIYRL